jgi:hypothetical protein
MSKNMSRLAEVRRLISNLGELCLNVKGRTIFEEL